ncbi:LON peptidase substrate-binding domain-containing protein [Salinivibrio sp. ES.052]|uniref:LON peptidase substrate-binding domain-containing protein n=1 Tax=Salinivibrio sp. ES.052 TaxID=1882823 RepID=UPI000927F2C8|nr:LON peptidase substrate-binding domain-containing protein [Salinivibrio sp. ES.052]SIN80713.1 Lon protease N-terminal domain-containing protein [Salinivibrio sp. ES.052]
MSMHPILIEANHLLPGGLHTYVVTESFYLNALPHAGDPPQLLVAMKNEAEADHRPNAISPIVTLCHVADFNHYGPQQIALTLQGIENVKVDTIEVINGDVNIAHHAPLPQWQRQPLPDHYAYLSDKLKQYYRSNPGRHDHFQLTQYDDTCWVCLRWLELLPIEVKQKQLLLSQPNALLVAEFIDRLLRYPLIDQE